MKKILLLAIFCSLFFSSWTLQAQSTATLSCGDTLSDRFIEGELSHTYSINIDTGTLLVVHSDPLPISASLTLSLEILNANGSIVGANPYVPEDSAVTIETSTLLATGAYQIMVSGDGVGAYQLFISCVNMDGDVISDNNLTQDLACGEQIDNSMIRADELHRYFLYLEDGMVMDVFLESLYGSFAEMTFELGLYSPTNQELDGISDAFKDIERRIFEQNITTDGVYRLYVKGFDSIDENYRLSIDCTLSNGDLAISGGENRRVLEPTVLTLSESSSDSTNDSSSDETQIDLIDGIPNTGQLTSDNSAITYTFLGDINEAITINYIRVRGDNSIDLAIQAPDGQMIFTSSLLLAESLSMQMMLPQSGAYQIVFTLSDDPQDANAVFTIEVGRDN